MSCRSRRKTMRIVIESRDPSDAKRIMDALRDATQGPKSPTKGNPRATQASPTEPPQPREFVRPVPDEQLETKISARMGKKLDGLDDEAKARNVAAGKAPDAPAPAPPAEIMSRRRCVWNRIWAFSVAGYRVTIYEFFRALIESMKGGG